MNNWGVCKLKSKENVDIAKTSIILTLILIFAKFASFIRDIFLAQRFGISVESDVFLASSSVLMIFVSFIRSPFSAAYLPLATDYYIKKNKEKQKYFFGSVIGAALVIGIVISLIEIIFVDEIISVVTPGFGYEASQMLKSVIYLQIPVITITFLFAVSCSHLRLINKFNWAEISNIFPPLFCILYLIILRENSTIFGLSIATVIGYFISYSVQSLILKKNNIDIKINFNFFNNDDLKKVMLAMAPFMIAGIARELNTLIDKSMGSLLPEGSISVLSYASKMTVTEVGLITTAVSMIIFAEIAKFSTVDDKEGIKRTVVYALKFINLILIPICILTIVLRTNIIAILFGRGMFDEQSIKITANTMACYAIGMIGFGMQDVLTRALHATKHRKYPALISVVLVCINITLNLLLYNRLGTYGLALASSIAVLAIIPLLYSYFNKNVVRLTKSDRVIKDIVIITIISLTMGICVSIVNSYIVNLSSNYFIATIISLIVAGIVYIMGLIITKNEILFDLIKRRKR